MRAIGLVAAFLVCFPALAQAPDTEKTITVDKTQFSDIYPAVWFSPSTGEITPLKEKSETPPEEKYEIWIEPGDPEFAFHPKSNCGFALIGMGIDSFKNPQVPQSPQLDVKLTHLMKPVQAADNLVFYCKAKTSGSLIMVTAMDKEKEALQFKWRPLSAEAPRTPTTAKEIAECSDAVWLEKIAGSLAEAQKLNPPGGLGRHAKDLRTAAYARLGALGTKESLAAIERIETKARGLTLLPKTVPLGVSPHPCWHFSDENIRPIGGWQRAANGKAYAVVCSTSLGRLDLFLISTATPEDDASWSRPKLIPSEPFRTFRDPYLRSTGDDTLVFLCNMVKGHLGDNEQEPVYAPQELKINISEVERDQDGDGWTDLEELRLGLDPQKKDTDGDGLADGMDACPNFAPPMRNAANEEAQIIQKALFATFGMSDSRYLLIVGPKSRKVQVWGYRGPIIYLDDPNEWRKEHGDGAIFVNWSVSVKGDEATVDIGDYEGPLAAGSQFVSLKKIGGVWVVTKRELGPVS